MSQKGKAIVSCRICRDKVELQAVTGGTLVHIKPLEGWTFTSDEGWVCPKCQSIRGRYKDGKLTKEGKLAYCSGCDQDFYNGKNPMGVKECWNLGAAKLVMRKRVSIHQTPPWKQAPIKILNCRQERGYIHVMPDKEY